MPYSVIPSVYFCPLVLDRSSNGWLVFIMVTLIWPGACGVFQRETLERLHSVEPSGCKSHLPWLLKSSAVCIKNIVSYQPHQTQPHPQQTV